MSLSIRRNNRRTLASVAATVPLLNANAVVEGVSRANDIAIKAMSILARGTGISRHRISYLFNLASGRRALIKINLKKLTATDWRCLHPAAGCTRCSEFARRVQPLKPMSTPLMVVRIPGAGSPAWPKSHSRDPSWHDHATSKSQKHNSEIHFASPRIVSDAKPYQKDRKKFQKDRKKLRQRLSFERSPTKLQNSLAPSFAGRP